MSYELCSICGLKIGTNESGWDGGCNAEPVNSGQCCQVCNDNIVLPRRAVDMRNMHKLIKEKKQ